MSKRGNLRDLGYRTRFAGAIAALASAVLTGGPGAAQTLGQGTPDEISIWRVLAALLGCLALAVGGAFLLKARMGQLPFSLITISKRPRRLQLLETLRLGRQSSLAIVACDGEELLVSASDQSIEVLERLPPKREVVVATLRQRI